jgi:hypothetical protein
MACRSPNVLAAIFGSVAALLAQPHTVTYTDMPVAGLRISPPCELPISSLGTTSVPFDWTAV